MEQAAEGIVGQRPRSKAFDIWSLTITIGLWLSIAFMAIFMIFNPSDSATFAIIVTVIVYLVYFITALLAPTFRYFLNTTNGADIYGYMQSIFYTPANLVFNMQCWHNETTHREERDENGQLHMVTSTHRVNTHSATQNFQYQSWRDISGKFLLDTSGAMRNQRRAFVRVHLGLRMEFAKDGTKDDYENQKVIFINKNQYDSYHDYSESTTMENFKEYNFVRVSDYEPKYFGCWWYFLFSLVGVVELYKSYVEDFCIEQHIEIIKVVSTRSNLNVVAEYNPMLPGIVYMGEARIFDSPPEVIPPHEAY